MTDELEDLLSELEMQTNTVDSFDNNDDNNFDEAPPPQNFEPVYVEPPKNNNNNNNNFSQRNTTTQNDYKPANNNNYNNNNNNNNSLNAYEKKLTEAINKLRSNPKSYKPLLQSRIGNFKGNIYSVKQDNVIYNTETHEGADAVKEAVNFLDRQAPCLALSWANGLNKASEEIRAKLGDSGSTVLEGGDKLNDVVLKYGTYEGSLNQLVCFGDQDADEIIATWLVGDGDSNRTARNNLFNKDFKFAGAALGSHKSEFNYCGVVHFVSGTWKDK